MRVTFLQKTCAAPRFELCLLRLDGMNLDQNQRAVKNIFHLGGGVDVFFFAFTLVELFWFYI